LAAILCGSHVLLSACGFSALEGLAGAGEEVTTQRDAQADAEAGLRTDAGSKMDGDRAGDSGGGTRDGNADAPPRDDGRRDAEDGGQADVEDAAPQADGGACGCAHGTCSDGGCVCDVGFTGTTSCDTCADGYFGQNCQPVTVGAYYRYVEAESGVGANTSPMMTGSDNAASGGQYTWSGAIGSLPTVPTDGHVTYTFADVPAGTFKVWGRFLVGPLMKKNDSLWIRMDAGVWTRWNDVYDRTLGAWGWDSVRDDANLDAPVTYTLTAGIHTLEVAYREDGLKYDKFLLTNDMALVP
jgi:hypothetical protein